MFVHFREGPCVIGLVLAIGNAWVEKALKGQLVPLLHRLDVLDCIETVTDVVHECRSEVVLSSCVVYERQPHHQKHKEEDSATQAAAVRHLVPIAHKLLLEQSLLVVDQTRIAAVVVS